MTKQDIIEYVVDTPTNSNKAVLLTMLDTLIEEVTDKDLPEEITNINELINVISSEEPTVNIKLASDISLQDALLIESDKTVTIDLNGKVINAGTNAIDVSGGQLTINGNGTIVGSARPLLINGSGNVIINGGNIISTQDCAVDVSYNSSVEFNDGTITAQEVGILVTYDSNVVMNGGTIVTVDNFGIGGNGNSGRGNTSITINGGKIEGHITSSGYVACGIYHPQDGELIINGGEIVAENGCGILMRAGELVMNGGTVIGSGESGHKGKVGDSKVTVGPNGIIYDQLAHYPDNQNLSIKINNGFVIGVDESIDILKDDSHIAKVEVIDGTFIPVYE